MIKVRILRWGDYPCVPDVIKTVLIRGRQEESDSEEKAMQWWKQRLE